jgi:hypothetical protein
LELFYAAKDTFLSTLPYSYEYCFFSFSGSRFANPSNEIIPTKLANLPGPALCERRVTGGKVMPSTAKIAGYSLLDMAQALAYFTTTGVNPSVPLVNDTNLEIPFLQQFRLVSC